MRRASRPLWCVLLVATVLACSDDENGAGPVEPPAPPEPARPPPSVLATVSLSDAPVEGELVLTPAENGSVWDFAVDLDGDGAFDDAEGTVDAERRVPYRFTEVGLHPVAVRFERPGTRITVERIVAVNDPDVFVVEARARLDRARPEGIAVTRDNQNLFVSGGIWRTVFRLRTNDLSVVETLSLGPGQGIRRSREFAISPSESRLFLMNSPSEVVAFAVPELDAIDLPEANVQGTFFIEAPDDRHIITSGGNGLDVERVDVETGSVVARHEVASGMFSWDLALSPGRDTVAHLIDNAGRITLLDAETLETVWASEVARPVVLDRVAFHPSGDRIYVLGFGEEAVWLFVLATEDGKILKELRIEPLDGFAGDLNTSGSGSPVTAATTTHDGRFVIFPTSEMGTYLVDTELDVPRFRSRPGSGLCCNAAAAASVNAIYFANLGGEIFRVRLAR